jgi:hypothetical protein
MDHESTASGIACLPATKLCFMSITSEMVSITLIIVALSTRYVNIDGVISRKFLLLSGLCPQKRIPGNINKRYK